MKKNKVINIVLFSLAATILLAGAILGFVNPHLLKRILDYAKELLNQPLPVVGITVGTLLIFIWRLVISTNYGKKVINELRQELANIKQEHEQYKLDAEKEKQALKQENQVLREQVANVCELSTNKKIKDYGKGLLEYGKETINLDTEKE